MICLNAFSIKTDIKDSGSITNRVGNHR